ARRMEFPQINIDLIAGMVEETDENWRECVRKTLKLQPDSVTIYQMEVPYNTHIYKQMKAEGRLTAPVAMWSKKRAWVKYAFGELEKNGYTVSSGYTAVKDPAKTRFVYRDRLWTGADLIGIGVSSFGHLGGTHYQNEANIVPYVATVNEGKLPVYRGITPTREDLMIRELILQMKLGGVNAAYFQEKFGIDILERFAEPIHTLCEAGFASIEGDNLRLNRDGLLLVDRLVHEFFLPEHRAAN
ncbi:MAG: coproporphyrinogen III oxidase, partial [Armatimonadota bacterium]|nr:coproporphyrinogen III oxidase [Armatimonadota bacterium]